MRTLRLKQPEPTRSSVSILCEEITRDVAGRKLNPPVTARTIQTYLEKASIYLPKFARFMDDNGGLDRNEKLTVDCVPTLQKISDYIRAYGMLELQIKLAQEPEYFSAPGDIR